MLPILSRSVYSEVESDDAIQSSLFYEERLVVLNTWKHSKDFSSLDINAKVNLAIHPPLYVQCLESLPGPTWVET